MATLVEVDTSDELLLSQADFPSGWVDMAHPDDYTVLKAPLEPHVFTHDKPHHNRILFRISFKVGEGAYLPVSFVVNTGAPSSLYIGRKLRAHLGQHGRLLSDETDAEVLELHGIGKQAVRGTSSIHQPANVVGLPLIKKLSLVVGETAVAFTNCPSHFQWG